MDHYLVILTIIGAGILGMAWMPAFTAKTKISYSIIYVLLGMLLYGIFDFLPAPDPKKNPELTTHLTELVVLVSLMCTGLKIDQKFSFRTWGIPFRLVTITMFLCIAAVTAIGVYYFNMPLASALLLAAVLSPTDPVLATDVQVGDPNEEDRDNAKFSLTAEAGFNDGMAFPFVWLAITVAMISAGGEGSLITWAWKHLVYQILAGALCGFLIGKLLAYILFTLAKKYESIGTNDGFVSIALTLFVYGVTEMVHGYGFVAVFIAALTLRNYERGHQYHNRLHAFSDQMERIFVAILLILFGGSLVRGILDYLTWPMAAFGVVFIFVIRPLSALIGLIGTRLKIQEKLVIGFFGIRGVGSVYYLAFAFGTVFFKEQDQLWSLVAFIILISIGIHGLTAGFTFKKLEETLPDDVEIIAK
ncbi:cation:proton antiporter [Pedobacter sp. MR2016-24]|uniref:cation:proton antiporter n=1 Tax=Pedobacter sp. MR2016-24 TaxID=2994466 RepID=UPI002248311E|nr:cation:proton antiporter [Pedobacter sp. MR2016-24]MCX2486180.1 cation:proton antiporter [Pedobacter sp. MR2016-24]